MIAINPSSDVIEIHPQPRQEQFLSSSADVVVFGGAAFGGKTYALEIEPLRHIDKKRFGAVIFRKLQERADYGTRQERYIRF
jgi:hypothetical protein